MRDLNGLNEYSGDHSSTQTHRKALSREETFSEIVRLKKRKYFLDIQ